MDDRLNMALVALRQILRATEFNARKLAEQSELTASQLLLMRHVERCGKALPSGIAEAISLKQATVTVLVKKLEASGLVTRRRDTKDRRRVWVELTDTGRNVLEESPDLLQTRFESGFDKLDDWEQAMIVATLERVAVMLEAEEVEAAPVLDVGELDRMVKDRK